MSTVIRNEKLFCNNCGGSFALNLPIGVNEMTQKIKAFELLHKDCPKTWQEPTTAIGDDIDAKINFWIQHGERGISSETIVEVLTGRKLVKYYKSHPHDPDDFSRCYKLLKMIPELKDSLPLMKSQSKAWSNLVDNWDRLTEMYEENVRTQWKNAKQIGMYELMQECINKK